MHDILAARSDAMAWRLFLLSGQCPGGAVVAFDAVDACTCLCGGILPSRNRPAASGARSYWDRSRLSITVRVSVEVIACERAMNNTGCNPCVAHVASAKARRLCA